MSTTNTTERTRPSGFPASFAVFAECLLTGVWIAVAALPLVTLPAALAAGAPALPREPDLLDTYGD
ncbi:hypothetical protein ACE14D_13875 [Streptomyces sp. Act-28]